jgi:hypothetical protein
MTAKRRLSQEDKVLGYLMTHNSITPAVAWKRLHVYRLSSAIHRLRRKRGWSIRTEIKYGKNGEQFAVYRMN